MNTTTEDATKVNFICQEKTIFDEYGNPSSPVYYVASSPDPGDRVVAGPFKTHSQAIDELEKNWI